MDRSLFPEGVEVHQTALKNIGTQVAFHTQRRLLDLSRTGRASGLDITLGAGSTRFNMSAGWGYTPRGDYIESTAGAGNFALADYTLGVLNYVCLIYNEVSSQQEAHESSGDSQATIKSRASTFRVLSATEYAALPDSADADLAINLGVENLDPVVKDRILIVAVISGKNFASGSTPNAYNSGDFTNGLINQQAHFTPTLSAIFQGTQTISGVNVKTIQGATPLGPGSLELTVTTSARSIKWAEFGHAIPVGGGTAVTSSGLLTVPGVISGHAITLEVFFETLPVFAPTSTPVVYTDTIAVSDIYAEDGAAFSAVDGEHRSKTGSSQPSQNNPHGFGAEDFLDQILNFPQLFRLGANYLSTAARSALARITALTGSTDRVCLFDIGPTPGAHARGFFNPANKHFELSINARWDGANWNLDQTSPAIGAQLYSVGPGVASGPIDGLTGYQYTSGTVQFADSAWATDPRLIVGGQVTLGSLLLDTAAHAALPRLRADRTPSAPRTLLFEDGGSGAAALRIYLSNIPTGGSGSFPGPCLEFTVNALWDSAANKWTNVSGPSSKFDIGSAGFQVSTILSGLSPWSDDYSTGSQHWTQVLRVTLDGFSIGGTIEAGSGSLVLGAGNLRPRFRAYTNAGGTVGDPQNRWLVSETRTSGATVRQFVYTATGVGTQLEETVACDWNGSVWVPDAGTGSAGYKRFTTRGILHRFKNSPSGSWADAVGAGGWDSQTFSLDENGLILPGGVQLSQAGLVLPIAAGTPVANTLYSDNIPKAWGVITQPSNSNGTQPVLVTGFNVGTPTLVTTDPVGQSNIGVPFQTNITGADYVVIFTIQTMSSTGGATDELPSRLIPIQRSPSGFRVRMLNYNGEQEGFTHDNSDPSLDGVSPITFGFVVYGRQ